MTTKLDYEFVQFGKIKHTHEPDAFRRPIAGAKFDLNVRFDKFWKCLVSIFINFKKQISKY